MKKWLVIIICSVSLSCTHTQKMPSDFYFKRIDEVDSYDSRSGKYTRKMVTQELGDTTIIDTLSKIELNKIYQLMTENDIQSLPTEFPRQPSSSYVIPSFTTRLEVRANGITKKMTYLYDSSTKQDEKSAAKFERINSGITTLLKSKPRIKRLPETKIIFL